MRIATLIICFLLGLGGQTLQAAFAVKAPATPTQADVEAAKAAHEAELATMTARERRAYKRQQRKDIKQALKDYKKDKKAGKDISEGGLLLIILAILLPPLAVYLYTGEIGNKFWISVILTLLVWVPGIIYALLVITDNAKK